MKTLNDIKKRIGILKLSNKLLESIPLEVYKGLFTNFIPTRIKSEVPYNQTEYTGYSELFDEVNEGEETPQYICYFRRTSSGKTVFMKFMRIRKGMEPTKFLNDDDK